MLVPSKDDDYFPYDVTMFWEFFRWERYKLGHIYLQCFKNGKLYAGQSIRLSDRIYKYSIGIGSNPHHTNAIEKHGWSNVNVMTIQCPWYLLDTIEIFLIEYYDLTKPDKGYNKTTGGRKNWTHSKEIRTKISIAVSGINNPNFGKIGMKHHNFGKKWTKTLEQIAKTSGENNIMYGNGHLISGEKNPMFGKKGVDHPAFGYKKTPEQLIKVSGQNSYLYCKTGVEHPAFGTKRTLEQLDKFSGENNGRSKPVCVFGKVYPTAQTGSNALRTEHAPNNKHNFIIKWTKIKKHKPYTFYITKEFYKYATENNLENITRDFYDKWLLHV